MNLFLDPPTCRIIMTDHKTAIVSVFDKTGVVDFCKQLAVSGWTIISTGGTEKALKEAGVAVKAVSDVTQFPEILGGRVKTLHPSVRPLFAIPCSYVGPILLFLEVYR